MSRFTEHFDTNEFMYSQCLSSPSKSSFLSMSSTDSSTYSIQKQRPEPISTHSFQSIEQQLLCESPTSIEEKPMGTKLKRFLTTISKKKTRSMSNHSQ